MQTAYRAAFAALVVTTRVSAAPPCDPVAPLAALVQCALRSSELIVQAEQRTQAAAARKSIAQRWLPANPTLDLAAGHRNIETGGSDTDRGIEISQSFEIGGQRGARLSAADAELEAARSAGEATAREVTTSVIFAAVQVVRARAALQVAAEHREAAARMVAVARARVSRGVAAPLEAELAEAAEVESLRQERLDGAGLADAEVGLASAVGADVRLASDAALPSVSVPAASQAELEERAVRLLPEVIAARAETESARARAEVLRRARIPDLTVAAGFRHEESADIVGARLSVPLPVFHRNQGEIAEEVARGVQAEAAAKQGELRARFAVRTAIGSWNRARAAVDAIAGDLDSRLRADAAALATAYERGTMPPATVLASLRETRTAREIIVDTRAEATLAALTLLRAAALPPCGEGGCR